MAMYYTLLRKILTLHQTERERNITLVNTTSTMMSITVHDTTIISLNMLTRYGKKIFLTKKLG